MKHLQIQFLPIEIKNEQINIKKPYINITKNYLEKRKIDFLYEKDEININMKKLNDFDLNNISALIKKERRSIINSAIKKHYL